jgi:uncharacterized protein
MPGAPPLETSLAAELQAALAARGAQYQPRTHHLHPDGAPRYLNRLVLESSPYLLQHAHNPVNWYAWGDAAFADARRLGRPVFLSVGYSTCHWCHVMEEESFESEEIAAFLNAHYIPIKVDREERPDVDAIYMSAVQALTGSGGWPMSVWLTPDREPFFGGTYFPPHDGARGARFGFLTVLRDIARTYAEDPERVRKATGSLTEAVKQQMEGRGPAPGARGEPGPQPILIAVDTYKRLFDATHGGLRRAPKFPSNIPARLLLRVHRRTGDDEALLLVTRTLEKMAGGGLYDQVGGGFHRYSTDERWLVPHFEKMLYDNALLAVAYAEAWQVTRRPDFARVLRETLDYLLREMTSPEGAFYSATDADSEGEEGRFFVWSAQEIRELLGPSAERFMRYYDVSEGGNFEGHNILNAPRPDEAEQAALAADRQTLYEARARRVAPLRDDKILAAWNGLAISAFAFGGRVLGEGRYLQAATRAADFLLSRMRRGTRILRAWKDGRAAPQGFLEDQVFVAAGLLDLYESTFDRRWLEEAIALHEALEKDFADPGQGGWFMTAFDAERLIAREKPQYDGAEPSGTSVALLNVQRIYAFTGDERWRDVAARGFVSVWSVLSAQPLALAEGLLALDYLTDVPREIAVVLPGDSGPGATSPLLETLRTTFVPNRALVVAVEGADLAGRVPFFAGKVVQAGQATAYVCERGRCDLPTSDAAVLERQLRQAHAYESA